MYVCVCNGHRDSDIRRVAETGLSCARQIYRRLGKPVRCGRCLDFAASVIAEAQAGGAAAANSDDREAAAPKIAAVG
jgi:bacterioferritin-associated ferredoxin